MNWTAPEIYIHATDQISVAKAQQLATKTKLPLAIEPPTGWRLLVENNALQLVRPDGVAVSIDFINGRATRQASEANFKKQPLARALGLQKLRANSVADKSKPSVIDATAGFGTDAWMMASLGCSVTLLEQSTVLSVLLEDAIEAACGDIKNAGIAKSLSLHYTNALNYLVDTNTASADVIYLDPMYPQARKQALVKKGMQLLHELIGPDENNPALLQAALNKALYRVVVKRPKGAPVLAGSEQWAGQITSVESPNTRFDVYHISQ